MLFSAVRFNLRCARRRRMHRLLYSDFGICHLRSKSILRPRLSRPILRPRLSRLGHSRGWRSALLRPWPRLLRRRDLLRMEARPLGNAARSASLDPWPVRRTRILNRAIKERRLSSRRGRSGDRSSLNNLNERLREATACQAKTHSRGQTA